MTAYHFATLRRDGTQSEKLPAMDLKNDDEAADFGTGMIRDLIHEDPQQYSGWVMSVTDGSRAVHRIPFAGVVRAK